MFYIARDGLQTLRFFQAAEARFKRNSFCRDHLLQNKDGYAKCLCYPRLEYDKFQALIQGKKIKNS